MSSRTILVTHALPYANGPLHIGHLLGYIQSDIWVRARRMAGDTVHFVAADDVHGTPIMLAAEKAGMAPEEFIKGMQVSHERDFADFGVAHDYYYTTHSAENKELAELVNALTGNEMPIALQPARNWDRSGKRYGDPAKAEAALGFSATVGLRDGLTRTIEWTRQNNACIQQAIDRHARFMRIG